MDKSKCTKAQLIELLTEKEEAIEMLVEKVKALQDELNKLMLEEEPSLRRVKEEDLHKLHAWAAEGYNCKSHPNHPRLIKGLALAEGAVNGLKRGNIVFKIQGENIYFPR